MGSTVQSIDGHAGLNSNREPTGSDPRLAAYYILRDVDRGEFADHAASRHLGDLQGPDRGLALEVAYGSIRLRSRLDAELALLLDRPIRHLDRGVLAWLRLGLYQVRETRVPDHAAVDQTVRGLKRTGGSKASGLANAVLRRAVREGPPEGAFPDPAEDPAGYLTVWGSHPGWLIGRWLSRLPLASVSRLVENDNRAPPVTVRVLDAGAHPGDDLALADGVRLVREPGWRAVFRLEKGRPEDVLRSLPAVVQDPAAAAVVDYVGDRFVGPVLDACAAPGGKTLGLAWRAPEARPFVAADVSGRRLARLKEPLARLGLDVTLLRADARAPAIGGARTVLLDVPCTGTGVLRRRPDARWRLDQERLDSLVALQSELLTAMAASVDPGGLLVYATCSLEPEENEQQVERFLARHSDFRREPPEPTWVRDEAVDDNGDLRVEPWKWDTDGAYASRLRRS
jgi:16S rRNA (cytosine967-C5)-methyltransferase